MGGKKSASVLDQQGAHFSFHPLVSRFSNDLRGVARLATDATVGVADLAEALHAQFGLRRRTRRSGRRSGISGLVYRSVRGIARISGRSAEAALLPFAQQIRDTPTPRAREALVAALNGVLGDGLAATGTRVGEVGAAHPLAIEMRLRRHGAALDLSTEALAEALPRVTPHVVVLVHGLCMNDLQWTTPDGHDHGVALERDTALTAVSLNYNSGLHISTNGRAFAERLERLVAAWPVPVESLSLLSHSMGGLVSRSALHVATEAGMAWPSVLRRVVFLGTPHHGSPVERGGNRLDRLLLWSRFSAPFARLGHVRSAGITDLRHGALLDDDWQGVDRFESLPDPRRSVPLPAGVEAFAMASTAAQRSGGLLGRFVGDGLVSVAGALGRHADLAHDLGIPEARTHVATGVHHFGLLGAGVYPIVRRWLDPIPSSAPSAR